MPKSHHRPDEFYAEIPRIDSDPFSELGTEIEDEHETADYEQIQGLSAEQVSQIAKDALELHPTNHRSKKNPDEALDSLIEIFPQRY